jgi:hypothetical protein
MVVIVLPSKGFEVRELEGGTRVGLPEFNKEVPTQVGDAPLELDRVAGFL